MPGTAQLRGQWAGHQAPGHVPLSRAAHGQELGSVGEASRRSCGREQSARTERVWQGKHGWGLWGSALPLTDTGDACRGSLGGQWRRIPNCLCLIAFGMPGGHQVEVTCGQLRTARERPEVEPGILQTHVPFRALGFCLQGQP
uniref:cDNA FLJ61762 n=1 Tax=Homo sapiens TaxID=9606 RepID=B7Z244_HUMAN|nr:unnamed protein product [Homo sapiens]